MLPGCTFHVRTDGVAATQETVQQTIDEKLPTEFHEFFPELPLGHSQCPDGLMELDHDKIGRCTLVMGDVSIPVMVKLDAGKKIVYATDGSLFDMTRVSKYIQQAVSSDYHVSAIVACGDPRYRVLHVNDRVTCPMSGTGLPSTISFKTLEGGHFFIFTPQGLRSGEGAITAPLLALHKRGLPVVVQGSVLERLASSSLASMKASAPAALHVGDMTCPATVDLSGKKRGVCHFDVSGKTAAATFWIDGNDWRFDTDFVISKSGMEAAATKHYKALERNNGFSANVAVHCDMADVVVLTPPAQETCRLVINGKPRTLTIHIPDRSGTVAYYVE
jgi:hypothetical protein